MPTERLRHLRRLVAALALTAAPAFSGGGGSPVPDLPSASSGPSTESRALPLPPVPAPGDTAALRSAIEVVLDRHRIPGAGAALVATDSLLWLGALGLADRGGQRGVDTTTAFRAGSISKSALGVMVALMDREGWLGVGDPIRDHLPELTMRNPWAPERPVRLVHLMEHTAGFDDLPLREYARDDPAVPLADAVAGHPEARRVRWPPGTHVAYSNVGAPVAALALEEVVGEPFDRIAEGALFRPLGMAVASFRKTQEIEARLATGYRRDGATPVPYRHIPVRPAGALNLVPRELAHFTRLLLGRGTLDGHRLLDPATVEWMERPSSSLAAGAGLEVGYGFGIAQDIEGGFVFHGHDGAIDGHQAAFGYLPDEGLGYVLMVNSRSPGFRELRSLLRAFLVRGLESPPRAPRIEVPEARLQAWSGFYELVSPRWELTRPLDRLLAIARVRTADGPDLRLSVPGRAPVELVVVGDRLFRVEDEPKATVGFLADPEGRLVLVGTGSALQGSWAPTPSWSVWTRWTTAAAVVLALLSALGFALIWIPRWILGKLPAGERVHVRALPAAAAGCFLAAVALPVAAGEAAVERLGAASPWSVSFFLLTVLFALLAVAGTVQAIRAREKWTSRPVRVHALLVSGANLLALLYLAGFGLLGMRLWMH